MEQHEQERLSELIRKNSENAERYLESRKRAAIAKYELDVLIGAKYLTQDLNMKCAYEKALIIVSMKTEENRQLYKDFIKYTAEYKGLEKVLEANADQIRWAQSRMKYAVQND